jgi:hypothetical protein
MGHADHPAGKRLRCAAIDCGQRPAARVAVPPANPAAFAVVRPLTSDHPIGEVLCLDHVHHAVDAMLMRATPAPTPTGQN